MEKTEKNKLNIHFGIEILDEIVYSYTVSLYDRIIVLLCNFVSWKKGDANLGITV